MILVDAGPLIALIHADDQQHERCKEVFDSLREPMGTVWPALAEAVYLFSFSWKAQGAFWEMMETEAVLILALDHTDVPRMTELMRTYRDLPWIWRMPRWYASRSGRNCAASLPSIDGISRSTGRPASGGFPSFRSGDSETRDGSQARVRTTSGVDFGSAQRDPGIPLRRWYSFDT